MQDSLRKPQAPPGQLGQVRKRRSRDSNPHLVEYLSRTSGEAMSEGQVKRGQRHRTHAHYYQAKVTYLYLFPLPSFSTRIPLHNLL